MEWNQEHFDHGFCEKSNISALICVLPFTRGQMLKVEQSEYEDMINTFSCSKGIKFHLENTCHWPILFQETDNY